MTTTGLIVAALAALIVLAYIAWTTRRAGSGTKTAAPDQGHGLLDEPAAAIEDVADMFFSTHSRR